mmetsp:Transcript_13817/g.15252  ORF Transcript_13817/g.15252 Transcript_13817/m.15252 type:complete len:82 (+) Transcript_13817:90-335(+)
MSTLFRLPCVPDDFVTALAPVILGGLKLHTCIIDKVLNIATDENQNIAFGVGKTPNPLYDINIIGSRIIRNNIVENVMTRK